MALLQPLHYPSLHAAAALLSVLREQQQQHQQGSVGAAKAAAGVLSQGKFAAAAAALLPALTHPSQQLRDVPDGPWHVDDPKIFLPPKRRVLTSMEELIHQFMLVTEGFECPAGEIYSATEAPKGELGYYVVSTAGRSPYRLRIRSPSFNNLSVLALLSEGGLVADVVANIGSLDPVMGEVDR